MNPIAHQATERRFNLASGNAPPAIPVSPHRTTAIERFLLMAAIVLLPLQEHIAVWKFIPGLFGYSIMYIIFGALGVYVLLTRPSILARMSVRPVFLAAYVLLFLGFLVESLHSNSSYSELKSYGYMFAGAVVVASLCRDRQGLRAGLYGYLLASIWLSVLLILTIYGSLQGVVATNLEEASVIRGAVFARNPLIANLNKMAFQTAQGVVVALTLTLTADSSRQRNLFLGVALFCLVATFLPMSRGGIVIAIVSCAVVMFAYQGRRMRTLMVAVVLGVGILVWAPEAAFVRLSSSMTTSYYEEEEDGRARIYTAAIEHLPEYITTGVGAGNFWEWWGESNGFGHQSGGVSGAHNSFFQVTIFWGLAGLLPLIAVIWQAYRCLPKQCGADALSLSLLGIAISLLFYMMVTHTLYSKELSLGLGMLAGARSWIWPNGIVQSKNSD